MVSRSSRNYFMPPPPPPRAGAPCFDYDADLSCVGRNFQDAQAVISKRPHITLEVSLEEFTPHYTSETATQIDPAPRLDGLTARTAIDASGMDEEMPAFYAYPCRCSASFVITHQDLEDGLKWWAVVDVESGLGFYTKLSRT